MKKKKRSNPAGVRRKGITVTVKKAPWLVKLEREARSVKRRALNTLATVGTAAVMCILFLVAARVLDAWMNGGW